MARKVVEVQEETMRGLTSIDRRRTLIGAGCTAATLVARPWKALAADETIASTRAGQLRGQIIDGVHSFLGVPYAAPPVGDLRLASPRPISRGRANATPPSPATRPFRPWVVLLPGSTKAPSRKARIAFISTSGRLASRAHGR